MSGVFDINDGQQKTFIKKFSSSGGMSFMYFYSFITINFLLYFVTVFLLQIRAVFFLQLSEAFE